MKHIVRKENGEPFQDDFGDDVILGCVFVGELKKIRAWCKDTPHPHLYYSTILVPLFKATKIQIDWQYNDGIVDYLSANYMIKRDMLKTVNEEDEEKDVSYVYIFRHFDEKYFALPLPNTEKITLTSLENISFTHRLEECPPPRKRKSSTQEQALQGPPPQPPKPLIPLELPEIPFKTQVYRENFLQQAYKTQQRISR